MTTFILIFFFYNTYLNIVRAFIIIVIYFLYFRNSQFQDEYSLNEIKASPQVFGPLTKLQCCPTSDGSAAAIVASEEFVHAHNLENQAVEILGMEMATDLPSTFEEQNPMKIVGFFKLTYVNSKY